MGLIFLIKVMYRMKLLSSAGIWHLISAMIRYGPNVMVLLKLSERRYGDCPAIEMEGASITYRQLFDDCLKLTHRLGHQYDVGKGVKVGLVGHNSLTLVQTIFAVSATGAELYLLHPDLSQSQLAAMVQDNDLQLLLVGGEKGLDEESLRQSAMATCKVVYVEEVISGLESDEEPRDIVPQRIASGRIMLLTGGTTGKSKRVPHHPSLFQYLPPFHALLTKLPYLSCRTVYIATPIAHGFGLANLFLFIALGYRIWLTPRFQAAASCQLIREHEVEIVTVVPLMLRKMLKHDPVALRSLACIASGGAELSGKLADETMRQLGEVLYNLYGTTEGGLTTIATPQEMKQHAGTIGRKIVGVPLMVLDQHDKKVRDGIAGRLCIQSRPAWLIGIIGKAKWIDSGDIGIRESSGLYTLYGRSDDMIVSGGENVYPRDVEGIIVQHPMIEDAIVIGRADEMFGQRLIAFVQPVKQAELEPSAIVEWLRPRIARFQMPNEIVLVEEIPYTAAGKPDKKLLK
ncbi:AMP-binding protein [Paenibacillus sp. strain BS8-2]